MACRVVSRRRDHRPTQRQKARTPAASNNHSSKEAHALHRRSRDSLNRCHRTAHRTTSEGSAQILLREKKQHTLKTEIQVSPNGKTLSVSKSFPGSVHDLTVRRQSAAAPPRAIVIADSGYQGYQHDHPCTVLPLKRTSPALILGVHFFRAIPRDSLTGRKLFARLRPITCRHYATDRLEPYTDFLPADQHLRSKKHTQAIESFHATVRHYLARFHRRTHCYSKSIDLVRATLNLFFFNELAIRPPAKPYSFP